MRRTVLLLSCAILLPALVATGQTDPHFQTPRIAATMHRSAFLHGYLHGYEDGFHNADFDLHMGRAARGEYSRPTQPTGYKKPFGSKPMFESGYREGFRVGYGDGVAGRSFRGFDNVVALALPPAEEHASSALDEGVRSGYSAGQRQGLDDARSQRQAKPAPACPVDTAKQPEFCAAYARGFDMGYGDGFVNQAKTTLAEAK